MNFGENLKRLRKERNLSQEQLSEMLNVSRQAISKWESNKTYPDIENLMLLRNIFNTTLDDLLFD
ncbi:helix-turn-helix family protein [Clostridioides difficile CD160]|nr:helix-turn-helix family protein [Clostridioides difficile CD160]